MRNLKTQIRVTIALGGLSLLAGLITHLALTDIYHGEADVTLEWSIVRVCALMVLVFIGMALARTGFESVDMNRRPNKCAPANRRYASPLNAGLQFGRVLHAQPCSPAAVAELGR